MKLCLIIPTQDHACHIETYLSEQANICRQFKIDIILYDTSADEQTELLADSYQNRGYSNIIYFRHQGPVQLDAIDYKVYSACQHYLEQYDYFWFSSDSTIVNIKKLFSKLKFFMEKEYDLLVFDCLTGDTTVNRDYTDCCTLLRDCCWRMTCLSSTVISQIFLRKAISSISPENPMISGFWIPMAYFHALSDDLCECKAIYFEVKDAWFIGHLANESFWKRSGNVLWQWCEIWCSAIESLPSIYDKEKSSVMLSHDAHTHLFSPRSLISMQEWGNISLKKINFYKIYLPKVTCTRLWIFYGTALFVPPFAVAIAKRAYHYIFKRCNSK